MIQKRIERAKMTMKILVFNAGSSSQKSCLYDLTGENLPPRPPKPLWKGTIDWMGEDSAEMKIQVNGVVEQIPLGTISRQEGIKRMLNTLTTGKTKVLDDLGEIAIAGHRVVHGGAEYSQATLITPPVKAKIQELCALAPAHNPANLQGIEAIEQILGDLPQVAVFDTAFHSQMPEAAAVYPIPYRYYEQGIRRYGFHGISHGYCTQRAAEILGQPLTQLKLITCHLGNGCSLAAVDGGVSINTTMGFTPLEGVMMGTRSGSIDPAILIHWARESAMTGEEINALLNKEAGLKGITGVSGDMRWIEKAIQEGNKQAKLAWEMYILRLKMAIGSMLGALGGVDALVFMGGVGENSPAVRAEVCQGLGFLGLRLDGEQNSRSPRDCDIASPDSAVRVVIVQTEEDWAIAQDCWHLGKAC
nr:acetate kinase [Spirulina subsalsa]